jgi:hypothetical protein
MTLEKALKMGNERMINCIMDMLEKEGSDL